MELDAWKLQLPYEDGDWRIVGFDDVEYRNDSVIGWDEFIESKVKKETGFDYQVRVNRFNFGIIFQSNSTQKKTRLYCAVTIAEQDNCFYIYLEDEDDFLPEKSCLDLKKLNDERLINKILTTVLHDNDLFQQLEERKQNYAFYEDFSGVRNFRRLQKFINNGCLFEILR